jgi:hypothetical protein
MAKTNELKTRLRELDNALIIAKVAAKRVQHAVPYAGHIYDAVDNVVHACEELQRETRDA